jgi:heavy metal sensor kinase
VLARLPIRLRLTLAFALATALVLAVTGAFLVARLGSSLDEALDESLQARQSDLRVLVRQSGTEAPLAGGDEGVAQVIAGDGTVTATTGPRAALLSGDELARAGRGRLEVGRRDVPGLDGDVRLLAGPVETAGRTAVLVVGASLEGRDEAVQALVTELLVVAPIALVLASLGGYWLATAALRPVERMRTEAAAISGDRPGERLTLAPARDEVHRLGATLNEMLDRLEDAAERERRFVADASHELRTPLAALSAELELALRRPRPAPELESALRSAAEECDRLTRLADGLLVLARADAGLRPHEESLRSGALLERVASRFAAQARPVTLADGGEDLELRADPALLEQALGNLVDNALRHGAERIELVALSRADRIELHVLDDGPGLPPDFVPRALERFSRADEARGRGGTGLGLAIVDAIARAHGGSAHVANREPSGADVWVSLPAARA